MRFIIALVVLFSFPIITQALLSDSFCVIDIDTKKIIRARKHLYKRAPASTVKLLTAMVVLDHFEVNQIFSASKRATMASPTKIYLKKGERMSCGNLLQALLLKSANDAAVVLAEGVAGSTRNFAKLMNQKARQIGCQKSNFVTPNGLPASGQYSCAYDLALIALHCRKYSTIRKILKLPVASLKTLDGRRIVVKSHNHMLRRNNPIYGKTGWTIKARHTFAGFTTNSGRRLAIAVMFAKKRPWGDLATLTNLNKIPPLSTIQRILQQKNFYKGKIDGVYGPKTRTAIKNFQRHYGLKVDGIVGPNTWRMLSKFQ